VLFAGIAAACEGSGGEDECPKPTVSTGSATSITSNSATLNGSVDPNGCETIYSFEYGTSASGSYPNSISGLAGDGTSPKSVSTNSPLGLQPSTKYNFRLSASSEGGTVTGGTGSFTTTSGTETCPALFVKTEEVSAITVDSATLKGSVNPMGCNVMFKLEWGPSSSPGSYPYLLSESFSGSSIKYFSKSVSALEPGRSYHVRASATPSGGTPTYGEVKTFTASALTDYVALGDSYSAGTGTGPTFIGEAGCHQSQYSYPYRLHLAHPELQFKFRACHGAETNQLIHSQAAALSKQTKWVTYTIGGNDSGFSDVLKACWGFWMTTQCMEVMAVYKQFIETSLPKKLDEVNNTIKAKAPYAKVVVLNYPRIFKAKGEDCHSFTTFLEADMIEMNNLAGLIGNKLREAAMRAGSKFTFVDVIPRFNTHALCDAQPWLTNYMSPEDESFHPNKLGHEQGYFPLVLGITG
jgi:lysophospholipase L1-like esterase